MEDNQTDYAESGKKRTSAVPPLWIWVIAVVLAGGLIAGAVAVFLPNNGRVAKSASEITFKSAKQGFSLKYPSGWERLTKAELAEYKGAFSFGIKHEKPRALLGVRVQKLKAEGAKLNEVSRVLDKTMPEKFDDFVKIGEEKLTLGSGQEALAYDYTFLADETLRIREKLLIVPTSDNVYYVTAWADAKSFTKILEDFEKINRSFSTD